MLLLTSLSVLLNYLKHTIIIRLCQCFMYFLCGIPNCMQNNFFWFIHWSKKLTFLSICILRESFPVVFFLSIIWFSFPFLWFLLAFVSWYITHFFHNIHLPHLHLSNFFNLLYFDCFFQGHLWQPIAINSSWWNQIRQSKGCCTKKRGFLSRTSFTLSDLIPSTTLLYRWVLMQLSKFTCCCLVFQFD